MSIEIIATVLLVEDDRGRLQAFRDYCKARGDIRPNVTEFSSNLSVFTEEAELPDLILLDVRLPESPADLKTDPSELPPEGPKLAARLRDAPRTASIPVVVYTQYAGNPHIAKLLNHVQTTCPNVVRVYSTRPRVIDALHYGLQRIRHLDLACAQSTTAPMEFSLTPASEDAPEMPTISKILFNGVPPIQAVPFENGQGMFVAFDVRQVPQRPENFLMVQSGAGQKSIFRIER